MCLWMTLRSYEEKEAGVRSSVRLSKRPAFLLIDLEVNLSEERLVVLEGLSLLWRGRRVRFWSWRFVVALEDGEPFGLFDEWFSWLKVLLAVERIGQKLQLLGVGCLTNKNTSLPLETVSLFRVLLQIVIALHELSQS